MEGYKPQGFSFFTAVRISTKLNKMKTNKIIEYVLSLPKSIYVSFRLLPFKDAVRVPVFVRYNCMLLSLKGSVKTGGGEDSHAKNRFR